MDKVQRGEWESRALIKDKKDSKTYLVNIDFISVRPHQLRMDIVTPLGMQVASVAVNGRHISYIVLQKKAYYEGAVSSKSFTPVLNLPLDPKLLFNILYDEPVTAKGWKCSRDSKGFVSECHRLQDPMKITWAHRVAKEKTVTITHNDFEVEMKFHSFSVPSTVKNEIFTIAQPNGFHKIF